MPTESKARLYERIRKAKRQEPDVSIRELSRRFGVHRRDVRAALASAVPPERKVLRRESPTMDPLRPIIDGWLEEDKKAPRKQRHTARRVWQRLVDEHGADVGESTVRRYVAEVRARQAVALVEVKVPQHHELGAEAEVDFGTSHIWLAGLLVQVSMFIMRLSASGRGFARAYLNETQEVFLDGHVRAFEHFGGVPGRIRYDNLKAAVAKVLKGRSRIEADRFVTLRSHYGFDSFFCMAGEDGAHEKGGVEGEVGRFRRRHLVPIPRVESVAELNELIAAAMAVDDERFIAARRIRVGEHFALEAPTLQPLPAEGFEVAVVGSHRVDAKARVCVRSAYYSVPARYVGHRLDVRVGAETIEVADGATVVACHARARKGDEVLVLDHYLEVLEAKPGALLQAAPLARARASGAFGEAHERFWFAARRRLGDADGTRALIRVLLAHRTMSAQTLAAGMVAALAAGSVDPEVVLVEARRLGETAAPAIPIGVALAERPAPCLDRYDTLLEATP